MNTEELYKEIELDFEIWKELSKEQKQEHKDKEYKAVEKWKKWLFESNGVSDNPKKELCYSKAYEMGHSSGYYEIEVYFKDLVELIKK